MRLHTNIKESNVGLIKSKVVWQLFFNLELTPEELELYKKYQLGERSLAKYTNNEGSPDYVEISKAVTGKGGHVFNALEGATAMKHSLIEGCAYLRDYMRLIQEIHAGGGEEIIDYPLHETRVNPPPAGPPTAPASAGPPVIQAGAPAA